MFQSFPVAKVLGIGGGPAVCPDFTALLGPGKSRLSSKVSPLLWGKWSVADAAWIQKAARPEGTSTHPHSDILELGSTLLSGLTPTVTFGRVLKVSHFWVFSDSSGAGLHGSQDTTQGHHFPRFSLWRRY
ncbi:hypothetical protein HJG60_010877 [Phyllostomus discolor]|uniref:Uncharacterized protein n=1 Tax=Phyllostomus discolor TaxID=89673 RepID=A0A834AC51_9CHIR|nr:hypothetical protein HJG60_010877 [Phyllostomus discolor]